ncbi:MAG TPA: sigma-70 family RNA polymerase sigma factor [Polyangiales bacterium]|nr:sigma-70 family RNA polymerase sigma factor [Polyangiales bacterium]
MDKGGTDFALLERWTNGERAAAEELFERYFDPLLRFFQNKVQHGVQDLVQQTWLACCEGRVRFRGDASFRTYLFQIARFQLYSHYRSRHRNLDLDFELASVVDLGTSPTGAVARKQDQRRLLNALRRIPLQYQIVLELRMWEDLTCAEIAHVLDLPEPTLRSRLRLAAERLRKELQADGMSEPALSDPGEDLREWARAVRGSALGS